MGETMPSRNAIRDPDHPCFADDHVSNVEPDHHRAIRAHDDDVDNIRAIQASRALGTVRAHNDDLNDIHAARASRAVGTVRAHNDDLNDIRTCRQHA